MTPKLIALPQVRTLSFGECAVFLSPFFFSFFFAGEVEKEGLFRLSTTKFDGGVIFKYQLLHSGLGLKLETICSKEHN